MGSVLDIELRGGWCDGVCHHDSVVPLLNRDDRIGYVNLRQQYMGERVGIGWGRGLLKDSGCGARPSFPANCGGRVVGKNHCLPRLPVGSLNPRLSGSSNRPGSARTTSSAGSTRCSLLRSRASASRAPGIRSGTTSPTRPAVLANGSSNAIVSIDCAAAPATSTTGTAAATPAPGATISTRAALAT